MSDGAESAAGRGQSWGGRMAEFGAILEKKTNLKRKKKKSVNKLSAVSPHSPISSLPSINLPLAKPKQLVPTARIYTTSKDQPLASSAFPLTLDRVKSECRGEDLRKRHPRTARGRIFRLTRLEWFIMCNVGTSKHKASISNVWRTSQHCCPRHHRYTPQEGRVDV